MMFEKQRQSSTEKVQDLSSRDTTAKSASNLNQSANKSSRGANMDPNGTGDITCTAELGERSSELGVKQKPVEIDSDTEAAADDGPNLSKEKRRKLQDC